MKRHLGFALLSLLILGGTANFAFAQLLTHWETRASMPVRRSNMATASMPVGDTTWIFTFMGIDSTKACGANTLDAYKYNTVSDQWTRIADVPGASGRIAASATAFGGKIYLFGGYHVDQFCGEVTSPKVDIYDPATDLWSAGAPIPTPTDDHVQVLWRDSLIILVSGWSQNTNIRNVQLYDPVNDTWAQSNLIAGPGLFGHCGGIWGDTLLYLDGVRISGNFILTNEVWKGALDPQNPTSISWTSMGTHSGPKVYRGGGFAYANRILFTGGTDNPYNIDGIGYNNQPSVESGRTFGFNLLTQQWEEYARNPDSVMDVREIVPVNGNEFYVVGGMSANQTVTNRVSVFVIDSVLAGTPQAPRRPAVVLFPNPVQDRLLIRGLTGTPEVVRFFDLAGRAVLVRDIEVSRGEVWVDTKGLGNGVWIVEVELTNGEIIAEKILK